MKCHAWGKIVCMELLVVCITTKLVLGRNAERKYAISGSVFRAAYFMLRGANMDNTDKLYECADSYASLTDYEYRLRLYSNGTIVNTTINFDISSFTHLCGLEKMNDLPLIERNPNSRVIHELIMNSSLSHEYVRGSVNWNASLNDPQTNNVTYTLEDRIETLTKFRDILNNHSVKAYSWNPDCHNSYRPYSSEIKADFMLVFESDNPKTSDERIYAFFKLDKNNPEIAHGMSQFPTDRTYNNDGRRSVPEITVMSFIEHDKVNHVDRVIFELPVAEQQRLLAESEQRSVNSVVAKDLRQLKGKRYKYFKTQTEVTRKAYERKLEIFGSRSPYTNEMLKEAENRLMAQFQDVHNSDVKDLILKEVELIKAELASREKTHEMSSGITIVRSVRHSDGTVSMTKPIVTIKIPQVITKAESAIKRAAHFVAINAADIVSNIKNSFSKPNKKTLPPKPTKSQTVKPELKAVQSVKSKMPVQEHEQEKEPLFSIAEVKSDKYAPTSSKGKDISRTKKNDLDL